MKRSGAMDCDGAPNIRPIQNSTFNIKNWFYIPNNSRNIGHSNINTTITAPKNTLKA